MAVWGFFKWLLRVLVTFSGFCFGKLCYVFRPEAADFKIFLCFRGRDVRRSFVGHLYEALVRLFLNVFLDDKNIKMGEKIPTAINDAIDHSNICIIVFSPNFARSPWCLQEAARIAGRLERNEQTVPFPIFFDVLPEHVRHPTDQASPFAKDFEKHISRGEYRQEEIDEWKAALGRISDRRGLSLKVDANRDETKLIELVVKHVLELKQAWTAARSMYMVMLNIAISAMRILELFAVLWTCKGLLIRWAMLNFPGEDDNRVGRMGKMLAAAVS